MTIGGCVRGVHRKENQIIRAERARSPHVEHPSGTRQDLTTTVRAHELLQGMVRPLLALPNRSIRPGPSWTIPVRPSQRHSRIEPMKPLARMLRRHRPADLELVSRAQRDFRGHRGQLITNKAVR